MQPDISANMETQNQNDHHQHHTIDITGYPENSRPSVNPAAAAGTSSSSSSTASKIHGVWIILQLILCVCQITVSIVILWWSRAHESPERAQVIWVEGYITGCLIMLPLICLSYGIDGSIINRLYVLLEVLKMTVGCFFAVWFVLGNVWINGDSPHAKKLDMLCQILLKSGCIVYAMPSVGCCLLPHMISSASSPRNLAGTATADLVKPMTARVRSFNALPTYRFKLKETEAGVVGVLATGSQQERVLSEEDAACCICLGKYAENDELRELPCCHFFHKECVDQWLRINARCPLCQSEISRINHGALTIGSGQNPSETAVGGATAEDGGRHGSSIS